MRQTLETLWERAYSLDRVQHYTILGATAALPKRLRIAARYRALARLHRASLARCDVLFIRHPKTGGTWLRVMLNRLYAQKYATSTRRVFKADDLHRQNPALPRFLTSHGLATWERLVGEAFRNGDPVVKRPRILFLARHPGDVAVSWHIQYKRRTKAFKRELIEAELTMPIDRESIARSEFLQHPELGLPAVIDYHTFWAQTLAGRENALIVRYEDLRSAPEATLARVAAFLGESFTEAQIAEAVAFASVDNLRELERSNYFRNNSLRLRDPGDDDTLKVRRAKVGGYRGDLDPEQCQWVDALIAERLDPSLGYGPSDDRGAAPSGLSLHHARTTG